MGMTTARLLITVIVSFALLVLVNIIYTNHVGNEAVRRSNIASEKAAKAAADAAVAATKALADEQKFCAVLTTLDGAYTAQPPTTPTGITVAKKMHELVVSLGCK
jgi:hypothetical protein